MQGDPNALTWKTDLDSAEDPTLSNAPARLMQLADGASFNVDKMENSFVPVQTPGLGEQKSHSILLLRSSLREAVQNLPSCPLLSHICSGGSGRRVQITPCTLPNLGNLSIRT